MARKILGILFVLIILCLLGVSFYTYKNLQPLEKGDSGKEVSFVVENGESLFSVIDRLEQKEVIPNGTVLKLYVKFIHTPMIKNGTYSVSSGMKPVEILEMFEQGIQELIKVTIPEG